MTPAESQKANQIAQFEAGARLAQSELTLYQLQLETQKVRDHLERRLWRSLADKFDLDQKAVSEFLDAHEAASKATLSTLELTVKKADSQHKIFVGAIEELNKAPALDVPAPRKLVVPGA